MYSIVNGTDRLTDKEEDVLMFYIKHGYSEKTKNAILKDVLKNKVRNDSTTITRKHLDVINHSLQRKGFLVMHPSNYRLKILSPELQKLSDTFMNRDGEKTMYIIGFDKK